MLKEAFAHFWTYRSVHCACRFLEAWCQRTMRSRIETMKKVARMLRRHQPTGTGRNLVFTLRRENANPHRAWRGGPETARRIYGQENVLRRLPPRHRRSPPTTRLAG
ncbi:MAG: transposase [Verrucomicrobiae bacterium]|nr:transposase [Verrucomicrobiae bacterium]